MNYKKAVELDNITLEGCIDLYYKKNIFVEINDGRVINLIKE